MKKKTPFFARFLEEEMRQVKAGELQDTRKSPGDLDTIELSTVFH